MPATLRFPHLDGVEGLAHAVTERRGGASAGPFRSWNLGASVGDDPDALAQNARLLREAIGATSRVRFPRQVHGTAVLDADEGDGASALGDGDAVTVSKPGRAVGVLGADCPGVIVVDPVRRALALAHSGWRGTVAGVVPAAVAALVARHGSRPADLLVGIGPGISGEAYEVGPEVVVALRAADLAHDGVVVAGRGDRSHVDLEAAIRLQARRAGVPDASVRSLGLCTFRERERFFSHRRDGGRTGRHALVALWRGPGAGTGLRNPGLNSGAFPAVH